MPGRIRIGLTSESADFVSPSARTRIMRSVGQRNTTPELAVRTIVSALGLRFRVCVRGLPGHPDLANRTRRWAIFVQGCFWHGHKNCRKTKSGRGFRVPVARHAQWAAKLVENRRRDARKVLALRRLGFKVVLVWECQLLDPLRLRYRLARQLRKAAAVECVQ